MLYILPHWKETQSYVHKNTMNKLEITQACSQLNIWERSFGEIVDQGN